MLCVLLASPVADAKPLPVAHAHNDYMHARPLLDALEQGFCSVEADIFRVGDELLVAHEEATLKPERTLRALYLEPLRRRARENGGRIYRRGPTVTLLIDIKRDGEETYALLRRQLEEYRDILTSVERGRLRRRAVTVILSGDCPKATVVADEPRYASIDGRVADLESRAPAHEMPLISDNWSSLMKWRGSGPMPDDEQVRLRDIVAKAHAAGRRVRFWGAPGNEAVWTELLRAGVDLLNADDLPRLSRFLRDQHRPR
jgi:hypothetical protein